jgi:hypothetical protein
MDGLEALTSPVGPLMSAYNTGAKTASDAQAQQMDQIVQAAKLQEILQRTQNTAQTMPLDIQERQQKLAANDLKTKAEQHKYRTQVLGDVIPELKSVPNLPGARAAYLTEAMTRAGVPLDKADMEHLSQQPDLLKYLENKHKWAVEEDIKYRRELDKQESKNDAMLAAQRARAAQAATTAANRAAATATLEQDLSKARSYQSQAAVYSSHAATARKNGDVEEATRLDGLAKQAQANDLKARSASGDAAAQRQLQLIQGITGGAVTPPTTPAALPEGWTLKK